MSTIRALCIAEHFAFGSLFEHLSGQTHAARIRDVISLSPEEGKTCLCF